MGQLTEWKNRYEAAFLASGQILYDWNAVTNDITWGGDYERILGYSAEEMVGGLTHWMALVHPDDLHAFLNEIDRVVDTRRPFCVQAE